MGRKRVLMQHVRHSLQIKTFNKGFFVTETAAYIKEVVQLYSLIVTCITLVKAKDCCIDYD